MLVYGLALLSIALSPQGQASAGDYTALRQALALSDIQMQQILSARPGVLKANVWGMSGAMRMGKPYWEGAESSGAGILDESQQARLPEIAKVLQRHNAASGAIVLGLISAQQWPGPSLCFYPVHYYQSEFRLSTSQVGQFMHLEAIARDSRVAQIREMDARRLQLLASGLSADSPEVRQLALDVGGLRSQVARPPRDQARALLNNEQRAMLADFERALELAKEAIELGLIPDPPKGEVLCH